MKKIFFLLVFIPIISFSQSDFQKDLAARINFTKEFVLKFKDESSIKYGNGKANSLKFLNFSDDQILNLKKIFKIQADKLFEKYKNYSNLENENTLQDFINTLYINEIDTRKLLTNDQLDLYFKNFDNAKQNKNDLMNTLFLSMFISYKELDNYNQK